MGPDAAPTAGIAELGSRSRAIWFHAGWFEVVPAFRSTTEIAAPVGVCFDLSRSIDLHLESMAASNERAIGGVTSGLIGADGEVSWEARHFGIRWRMTSRITAFDPPHGFVDEMIRGPFASFRHDHQFVEHGAGTRMTDVVDFRVGLGPIGTIVAPVVGLYLRRLIRIRNATIKNRAEAP